MFLGFEVSDLLMGPSSGISSTKTWEIEIIVSNIKFGTEFCCFFKKSITFFRLLSSLKIKSILF